ncbi:MAG: UDP-N-acetylglucosamine 2-epimerase [Marinifilaceae bacterium]|jgi:GDP/UDP-N,N'-diacetylbacillosamine 2-epimerase (hydrolysing)|nr:UDP-N-acetylglucosamine 2-epimerase [Marinifilaceae bacterium]
MKRKVLVITGTRAEYGLLSNVLRLLKEDDEFELQLIATGMHLSPDYGYTYKEIEDDGFKIDKKIEILLSSDSSIGVSKAMGLAQISFAEAFEELQPDLILVLGDRYEILSAVTSAMIARIPVAHLNGGEKTEGAIDESIRHSLTKMSHLHFTATEEYYQRVIQLGENPNRVFNVGEVGLDNITRLNLMSKSEFEDSINFKLKQKAIIITFHPVTLEKGESVRQFNELLLAVDELEDTSIIITHSNSDMEGRQIIELINKYVSENSDKAISFPSLGYRRYLSALQYMDAVVGNSSSGIVEAPSFKTPTINIGSRQKGRIQANSIINTEATKESILEAFNSIYDIKFQENLKSIVNPYGQGESSQRLIDVLKQTDFKNLIDKKFFDLN